MATLSVEQPENQEETAYQSLIPRGERVTPEVTTPEVGRPEVRTPEVRRPEAERPEADLPEQTRPDIVGEDRPESMGTISYDYPYQHIIQRIRRFFGFLLINRQSYLDPIGSASGPRPLSAHSGYLDPVSQEKNLKLSSAQSSQDKTEITEDSVANMINSSDFDDTSSALLVQSSSHDIQIKKHGSETDEGFSMTTPRPRSNREEGLYAELDETKMIPIWLVLRLKVEFLK